MDPELSALLETLKATQAGDGKVATESPFATMQDTALDKKGTSGKAGTGSPGVDGGTGLEKVSAGRSGQEKCLAEKQKPTSVADAGGWLYKYPSEGSKESAASNIVTYPRKCRACTWWLSDKEQYEKHLAVYHPRGVFDEKAGSGDQEPAEGGEEGSLKQLGSPRRYWFQLDRENNKIVWRMNESVESIFAGSLALEMVVKISIGVATPGVKLPSSEVINDFFTLQAKGRYVVVRAKDSLQANAWVQDLREAVFEMGQPPPGDDGSERLFSLVQDAGTDQDESLTAIGVEKLICNNRSLLQAQTEAGDSVLVAAIRSGLSHVVRVLLSLGANPMVSGAGGDTSLHAAAKIGSEEIVEALLEISSVTKLLNIKRKGGGTCVHDAARAGNANCLERLVAAGADPYLCDEYQRTPLHVVASTPERGGGFNSEEVMAMLCEFIEDALDWQDFEGNTALHIASRLGNFGAAEQLLQTAANPSIKNKAGATAHAIALAGNHIKIAELLVEYDFDEASSTPAEDSGAGIWRKNDRVRVPSDNVRVRSGAPKGTKDADDIPVAIAYVEPSYPAAKRSNPANLQYFQSQHAWAREDTWAGGAADGGHGRIRSHSPIHHSGESMGVRADAEGRVRQAGQEYGGQPMHAAAQWVESVTQDGERYFYNNFTGHTQWEVPPSWVSSAASGGGRNEGLRQHDTGQFFAPENRFGQQPTRLTHPSPPTAINTSPPRPFGEAREQWPHSQPNSPNQRKGTHGNLSPQSVSSNSSYVQSNSPYGSPQASPHVSPHTSQGKPGKSRLASGSGGQYVGKYPAGGCADGPIATKLRQFRRSPEGGGREKRTDEPPAPASRPTFRRGHTAMKSLAHPISPMNVDNPSLNKRLIEERRRARAARREKIRKSRKTSKR